MSNRTHKGTLHQLRLEAQIPQSQKTAALGLLAGGVVHDFDNLLTVIMVYAELAWRESDRGRARAHLKQVMCAANRGATVTKQLLAFGREQPLSPRRIELNKHLGATRLLLSRVLGKQIELKFLPCPQPIFIMAGPGQLQQILLNLCINGRDAMPVGGPIEIRSGVLHAGRDSDCPPPGWYAVITVQDAGLGIPPDIKPHIFEPFFTTKPAGQGTGLGLSMVCVVTKQLHGHIAVDSVPGHGTTFSLFIPLANTSKRCHGNVRAAEPGRPRTKRRSNER